MLGPLRLSDFPAPATPVKKNLIKRPAAAPVAGVLKRPAGSKTNVPPKTLNEKVSLWKQGLPKEDDDSESGHEDNETENPRDKGKGQKFAKMKNQLPAHIIDLYDNEAKKASSPRNFRTMVINKLFTKLSNGQYQLNAKDPVFEEHKVMMEKKYGVDEQRAYPRSIMKGQFFNNSNAALEEAIEEGSVKKTVVDGQEFFCFRTLRAGHEKSASHVSEIKGKAKISTEQYALFAETISSLGRSFDFTKENPKAIEGGHLTEAMTEVLMQAKVSNDKLNKEALKLLPKINDKAQCYSQIKKGITSMDKNLQGISHILQWEELPDETQITKDKFEKFVFGMAASTEETIGLIMTTKGALSKAKLTHHLRLS